MKHLRVTAHVDLDAAPAFFRVLADSDAIAETQVLEWNTTSADLDTVLFAIDGDATPFADVAAETPAVESVEIATPEGGWSYALMSVRPLSTPLFDAIHRARTRPGLVVRKPIVYRDGDMRFRVVGDPAPLQTALDAVPDAMAVRIDEIGDFRGDLDHPTSRLTERQHAALSTALELGYYEQPRRVTHADLGEALDCAPATAGKHLQKAEAKVVRAVLDEFGPTV